ncbi:hypothetical protein BZA70DRAFT_274209 [Myxozyma melibiosi]|uniref:Uncharacterized protein n=1 Tax=Myxozyma melibiosi TaxID=54550 RepID=A0ABR1FFH6_9ASCO
MLSQKKSIEALARYLRSQAPSPPSPRSPPSPPSAPSPPSPPSLKPKPAPIDTVDGLDCSFGGSYHHEGPFEATLAYRNSNTRYPPLVAAGPIDLSEILHECTNRDPAFGLIRVRPSDEGYEDNDTMSELKSFQHPSVLGCWPGEEFASAGCILTSQITGDDSDSESDDDEQPLLPSTPFSLRSSISGRFYKYFYRCRTSVRIMRRRARVCCSRYRGRHHHSRLW